MKPIPSQPPQFPIASLATYGPDNKTATKIVVGIFSRRGQTEPEPMHRWFKLDGGVDKDPGILGEITGFLKKHRVKQTFTTDLIMGCPHEEGVDYPLGGTCPHCPFWENIDRFTHEPKTVSATALPGQAGLESEDPGHPSFALPKAGRNDPCPCGSGKKFKKCCGA